MKLSFSFLLFFLLSSHFLQAQAPLKIKAGGARSSFLFLDQSKPIITWYGGVATTLRMGKQLFFQPELLYSKRGTNLVDSWRTTKIRYGYISMPLLLGWHPDKRIALLFGAEPGYMISEYVSDENSPLSNVQSLDTDRHFNVDIDMGFAYQPLPRWTVEIRFMFSLIGLYAEQYARSGAGNPPPTGKRQGYHQMVQFGLNYDLWK